MTERSDLDHERVAGGILSGITSGAYEVGTLIPSTKQLEQQYGVSQTTVRRAVARLQAEGILKGRPGKGVIVAAKPDDAAAGQRDLAALAAEVAELKRRVRDNSDLHEIVSRIEGNLIELYGKTGYDYPADEAASQQQDRRARHG